MSFQEAIGDIAAPELVRILGCPRATAYQWKDGRRSPPAWLQPHLLAIIERSTRRHKKHGNDASGGRGQSGPAS